MMSWIAGLAETGWHQSYHAECLARRAKTRSKEGAAKLAMQVLLGEEQSQAWDGRARLAEITDFATL